MPFSSFATSGQFRRDIKNLRRQGKDLQKLKIVMLLLGRDAPLSPRHRDHSLTGDLKGCRECHIEPDWLLIYRRSEDSLTFIRTGSHAELFK